MSCTGERCCGTFPREARLGFQLAFYRAFAVPKMARVLADTGHFKRDTMRRAYDTGIVIHEIIYGGLESERGRKMIRLMNALHDRPDIQQPELSYLLNAIIVVPTRHIARAGRRPLNAAERTASWRFCRELGVRMGIQSLPCSYADAEAQFDDYEAANLAPSPEGAAITEAVLTALKDQLPLPLRGVTAQATSALLDNPRLSDALSLPRPSRSLTLALRGWARHPEGPGSASPHVQTAVLLARATCG